MCILHIYYARSLLAYCFFRSYYFITFILLDKTREISLEQVSFKDYSFNLTIEISVLNRSSLNVHTNYQPNFQDFTCSPEQTPAQLPEAH